MQIQLLKWILKYRSSLFSSQRMFISDKNDIVWSWLREVAYIFTQTIVVIPVQAALNRKFGSNKVAQVGDMIYWTFSHLRYVGRWKNTCLSWLEFMSVNKTLGSLQNVQTCNYCEYKAQQMCRYVPNWADMCRYAQNAHHAARSSGTLPKLRGGHLPICLV